MWDEEGEAEETPGFDEIEQGDPFAGFHAPAAKQEEPQQERQVFQPLPNEQESHGAGYQAPASFAHLSLPDDEDEDDLEDLSASFALPLGRMQEQQQAAPQPEPEPAPMPEVETPASEDEAAPPFARPATEQVASFAADDPDEDDVADDDGANFASLLGMKNQFKSNSEEFVRIEDEPGAEDGIVEPAVVFPSEAQRFDRPAARPSPASAPVDAEENERALREALLNLQRMGGGG